MAKRGGKQGPSGEVARLENKVERIEGRLVQIQTGAFFSGPLPPPEVLKGYDDACPGAAERILAMAEKQADHRRSMESRNQTQGGRREWLGMVLGFVVAMNAIGGGVYLIRHGSQVEGLTSIIVALGGLVGVFIYARHVKVKELARKWNQMIRPGPPN